MERLTIVGDGMIGRSLAGFIQHQGSEVLFCVPPTHPDLGAGQTRIVLQHGSESIKVDVPYCSHRDVGMISLLLLATKATNVEDALSDIRHTLTEDPTIILIQNGLGIVERCQKICPNGRFMLMPCSFGASPGNNHVIKLSNTPKVALGAFAACDHELAHDLAQWFNAHQINTKFATNVLHECFYKLILNASLNGPSALHQCDFQTLAQQPEAKQQIRDLCFESTHILNGLGFAEDGATMWQAVCELMLTLSHHHSSMLIDLQCQRPTEIDFINGYLIDVAKAQQLPYQENLHIYQKIKSIEATW